MRFDLSPMIWAFAQYLGDKEKGGSGYFDHLHFHWQDCRMRQ
jgi:hypothetical protein